MDSSFKLSCLDHLLNNGFIVRTCSYNPQSFSTYFLTEPFLRHDHGLKPTFETVTGTYSFVLFFHFCSKSGKICGDTMQRAFLEWAYAKFEVDKLSQVQHFQCPACTPTMLAVAVDGNRKLYRFKSQPGPDGFFDGVFLANDAEVSSFVDYIHGTTGHNPGKGRCGAGQWTAARESANKSASKLDEEGVEVAVCRHGVLLKGLNMFRGEIFAYPLYLQKQLASQTVQVSALMWSAYIGHICRKLWTTVQSWRTC